VTTTPAPGGSPKVVEAAVAARLRAVGCVFAEDEAALLVAAADSAQALEELVVQRVGGLPLEQVLGWAELCGLRVAVEPGVFVPRRRTGLLVRQACALAGPSPVVVDLCCGSGAIGAAIASALGRVELHAADLDPVAVRCARRNVARFGGTVYEGDLADPLPVRLRGRVDVLVACPPYVPSEQIALMPPEARDHEPRRALDGGADGLDLTRRLAALAPAWLAVGGHLLVETSGYQAAGVVATFTEHGLSAHVAHDEELGATVVVGRRPAGRAGHAPGGR
jgi:release factor glutamine methyltransferase